MKIIKMTKKHVPDVIEVLADAFQAWNVKRRGPDAKRRLRTPECIVSYLELDPEGSFVAIDKRKIVGAIFAHVWGKFGWIGTFGVHPDYQEKGLGKELMKRAINYLDREKNVTKLSLETMNSSASNIGLYSKLGFRPAFQTISLKKSIEFSKAQETKLNEILTQNEIEVQYYSTETQREDALSRCNWLSSKIENGLEYSTKITITEKYKQGETIMLKKDGFIIAFANCRLVSNYQNVEDKPTLMIKVLLIDTDIKNKTILDALLLSCEKFGKENGKTELRMSINSSYWLAYEYLLNYGFIIRSSILRMIKFSEEIKAFDERHEWIVNCSSLTM